MVLNFDFFLFLFESFQEFRASQFVSFCIALNCPSSKL